ncbi:MULTISPECIES: twin-arginine translocase TatA/TatE family subunit [Nocardioides]|uniref:Sec-independent protein translocase protein TatA n=1 Tax=Nocardioides vastitatis TaxID=2568655 RepID=A0ABW0ZNU2_9ACTN|nr:twin-arginine translocase TatA/TatE family subunit [Nocardioides sp.]THI94081.1 twin-arginine translocase TatA/TatE family subunit [Nocardioides sp.]
MLNNLSGWHALVILAIVLLVFGSAKLPELARGLGQSVRILKDEVRDDASEEKAGVSVAPSSDEVAERRAS